MCKSDTYVFTEQREKKNTHFEKEEDEGKKSEPAKYACVHLSVEMDVVSVQPAMIEIYVRMYV